MVVLTLTKRFTQWLGPRLLKNGLRARILLGGGIAAGDNVYLDHFVGLTAGQWLLSGNIRDTADLAVATGHSDASWMDYWFYRKGEENKKDSTENNNSDDYDEENPCPLSEQEASDLRCAVLEKHVRKVLVPNEKWSDVQTWCFHHRLVKWLRKEYLYAKHIDRTRDAFLAFPELRQVKQLAPRQRGAMVRLLTGMRVEFNNNTNNTGNESSYLPPSSILRTAFGMKQWTNRKVLGATKQSMEPIAQRLNGTVLELRGGALCLPMVEEQADVSQLSLGEILDLLGGHVLQCGPLNVVCEEINLFQLWTQEYIDALGQYLWTRADEFDGETIVLDVGAGDGLLADSLREWMATMAMVRKHHDEAIPTSPEEKPTTTTMNKKEMTKHSKRRQWSKNEPPSTPPPRVIAIDDGSWQIRPKANVEKIGLEQALQKYCDNNKNNDHCRQVIVICSWMPMDLDWSKAFRSAGVQEYILIGECDDGQCGDNWETWGNPYMRGPLTTQDDGTIVDVVIPQNSSISNGDNSVLMLPPPPYQEDGYMRADLDSLFKAHQFSRFDSRICKAGKTVSFRRESSSS